MSCTRPIVAKSKLIVGVPLTLLVLTCSMFGRRQGPLLPPLPSTHAHTYTPTHTQVQCMYMCKRLGMETDVPSHLTHINTVWVW